MSRKIYRPKALEIEMTYVCNLRCISCAILDDIKKGTFGFSAKEIISILSQLKSIGINYYSLTGGEPFVHYDILRSVIADAPIDLIKINTNGFYFSTPKIVRETLGELKESGFGLRNKTIPAWLNISIGQQTAQGIPLENAVFIARDFNHFFPKEKARLSLNVFSPSRSYSYFVINEFLRKYKEITGKDFNERKIPFKFYEPDGRCSSTALRMGRPSKRKQTIKSLIREYLEEEYLGLNCYFIKEKETFRYIGPRMLLRADGSLYTCIGYSHVHKMGNIHHDKLNNMIDRVNEEPIVRVLFMSSLKGLLTLAEKKRPGIGNKKISISYGPCDICKLLTGVMNHSSHNA